MTPTARINRVYKPAVFMLCLLPLLALTARGFAIGGLTLGANPVEALQDALGQWGLRFLLITLAVTPLRRITGWNPLIRFRRMLGLFAFFYVSLHFLVWMLLDRRLVLGEIVADVSERPFITIGFVALVLLVPLAVTSTKRMMRRLGRHWQRLHRLTYPIAILSVWHYWWQVKQDIREPAIYAAILAILLGWRVIGGLRKRGRPLRKLVLQRGESAA